MTVTVEVATESGLRRRRKKVLDRVGMTFEQMSELATTYSLTSEELLAWDELKAIQFLLDDK
ncbi:hypothetical protein [Gordonia amicalis]|uniref:hypothetical protein n=1 Tax=Gordonia amicalis TaxID=89053 RepID=UPI0002A642FF|nr:hypothetical protein [Gordonia amicalis]NKX78658.1 hypothetical protein [Gordonia amicalis]GAC55539.1 hypothetical protein GOAMI_57_00060 [Gordonia amicalis NBRC 100051 = JCM 11271]